MDKTKKQPQNNKTLAYFLELNRKGIIPFPSENDLEFFNRAHRLITSRKPPPSPAALEITKKLFGLEPDWVDIVVDSPHLAYWQGGVTLFTHIPQVLIRKKPRGFYSFEECLAHELLHVGRMHLKKSKYEEFFAYQSSQGIRALLGPLMGTPFQANMALLSALLTFVSPLFLVGYGLILTLLWVKRKRTLEKATLSLIKFTKDAHSARALLYRLTDEEIEFFAKKKQIRPFIESQNTLRWHLFKEAYFTSPKSHLTS